ncbi:caspase-6 [Drosophila eugracilis]|uniref:caspase-6 n=1 Tax=Drosophila eugracilis TaxID=29029 RepID=UPI0007E82751|nr:caspase-6 [Drosophila eugracilis]
MYFPPKPEHQKITKLYEGNEQYNPIARGSDAQRFNGNLKRPVVYIFNHEEFTNKSINRPGSTTDVQALRKTFKNMKCEVNEISNPTSAEVKNKIRELAGKSFDRLSGFVIVILSHGGRGERIVACDSNMYHLDDDILFPLFANKSLRGKPKILIVQACKGEWEADAALIRRNNEPYIKCYSSSEGFVSYRRPSKGSIFIQTLCNEMDHDGLTKDFRKIIENVKQKVENESKLEGSKQTPSVCSNLTKPFCFGDYDP